MYTTLISAPELQQLLGSSQRCMIFDCSFDHSHHTAGEQQYVAFRRGFALPSGPPPASAALHLFADARYQLFVNGAYVARGPGRFDPRAPSFDSIDVASLLQPGANNTIALLAHNYGSGAINGRIMYHAPGVTARLDLDGAPALATDAQWSCSAAATEHMPSPGAWSSIPDVLDMRVAGAGAWQARDFDDSAWARASAASAPPGASWGALQPRALPLLREAPRPALTLLYPTKGPLAAALPITLRQGESIQVDFGRTQAQLPVSIAVSQQLDF